MREVIIIKQKLTDLERQQIIAEYVAGDGKTSQQYLADKYGVSRSQISKLVTSPEGKRAKEQHELNKAKSMREFKRQCTPDAIELFGALMKHAKELVPDMNAHETMGAIKIISEVFDTDEPQAGEDFASMESLAQMLKMGEGEDDGGGRRWESMTSSTRRFL